MSEYCTRNLYSTKIFDDLELEIKNFIALFNLHHSVTQHDISHKNIFFDYCMMEGSEDLKKLYQLTIIMEIQIYKKINRLIMKRYAIIAAIY